MPVAEPRRKARFLRICDPSRYLTAKFRLNRRPGPGSANQQWLFGRIKAVSGRTITGLLTMSMGPERAEFLAGKTRPIRAVVPAKAGTHNHRPTLSRQISTPTA